MREKNCIECGVRLDPTRLKFCSRRCKDTYHVRVWRRRTKLRAVELLGGKCAVCGYKKYPLVLEFHHPKDRKNGSVAMLMRSIRKWETILKEIRKCELRCPTCHKATHLGLDSEVG